jgi:NADH dehydrogenase
VEPASAAPAPGRHIVVLGGGFGGVSAALRLEQLYARDPSLHITLVSRSNYLLFTPMLAEVASGSLQARHISAPVRASCPHTRFVHAEATAIDTERQTVQVSTGETLAYDHLVLALGSVPSFHGLPGLEDHAFTLKTLYDATRLRNHVIGQLERADVEADEEARRCQLTFVVAGGGFAGTEMIAELHDLVHDVRRYYPRIRAADPHFVLVHSRDRILPELGPELADYALKKLEARGIEFVLKARVAGAEPEAVLLKDGRRLPTRTLVWTAGNRPNPLLEALACDRDRRGAVVTDATLQVQGLDNVWAVGDCAQIPNPDDEGRPYPPTAQHALRQGKVAAENIAAVLAGRPGKPFRFQIIGLLVALGHRTAAAEIRGRRFSGLLAWFMWRGIYLSKLPGLEKKLRVLLDWAIDLFFPRDIVLTAKEEG